CFTMRWLPWIMRVTSLCFDVWLAPISKLVTLTFSSEVSDQIGTISDHMENFFNDIFWASTN
ncbi:hypothetical protein, partial [Desulforhopalus singaporensis]|uniref:hypothetical protein n=1 Tax=Desulforhopalus singaporensis TaxID=91360 RepID=UPI001C40B6F0